ncbi:hypothetical protein LB505_007409 [Fusarium chuoi]|nr:hypothetical protein LB505_007409 [Fusarium chuoi]
MPLGAGGRRDGETTALTATGSAVSAVPKNSPSNRFVKRYRTEIAASSSSVFSTLAAFPLDSVKTRMQTYHYNGFLDCLGLSGTSALISLAMLIALAHIRISTRSHALALLVRPLARV